MKRASAGFDDGARDEIGVRFVGKSSKDTSEILSGNSGQQLRGGASLIGIEAEVQGTLLFEGEPARRVIELHGGDAKIGEKGINGCNSDFNENLGQSGKICVPDN